MPRQHDLDMQRQRKGLKAKTEKHQMGAQNRDRCTFILMGGPREYQKAGQEQKTMGPEHKAQPLNGETVGISLHSKCNCALTKITKMQCVRLPGSVTKRDKAKEQKQKQLRHQLKEQLWKRWTIMIETLQALQLPRKDIGNMKLPH